MSIPKVVDFFDNEETYKVKIKTRFILLQHFYSGHIMLFPKA